MSPLSLDEVPSVALGVVLDFLENNGDFFCEVLLPLAVELSSDWPLLLFDVSRKFRNGKEDREGSWL